MMINSLKKTGILTALATLCLSVAAPAFAQTPLSAHKAIETALANNPSYQSVGMGVDIAKLELDKAKAARLPTLDIRSNYTHYSDPMIIVPIHEAGVFPSLDRDIFTSGLYAQMPLYTGGRLDAANNLARAQIKGSKQASENMKQALIFSVMQNYSELLTLDKLKQASDQRLDFYRKEQSRIALLLSQGKATKLDQAKINAAFEKAKYERLQLDTAYDQNKINLSSLMSSDVPSSLLLTKFTVAQSVLPSTRDEALSVARREHPALREAAAKMEMAESKVNIARAAKKPQLSAIGNARAMSGGNFSVQNEWQLGVQFTVPLFDGKIKSRNISQARIGKTQARLAYDNLVNQTNASVKNAWQSMDSSRRGISVSKANLTQAKEALRIETLRYENSRSTLNDLTLAEASLWEAQSNLARSENLYELSKAQLLMAMGILQPESLTPSLF
ncbi:MAG: TolC family protein [Robiginitomaculum sp.]|nr:TolC family protein [Robiginitomaculum sp.]